MKCARTAPAVAAVGTTLLLGGCTGAHQSSPVPSPTATTATATASPTETPSPSETPSPTETRSPTVTPTPSPTLTPEFSSPPAVEPPQSYRRRLQHLHRLSRRRCTRTGATTIGMTFQDRTTGTATGSGHHMA